MKKTCLATLLVLTLSLCWLSRSWALNVQLFRPDIDGRGQLTLLGSQALPSGHIHTGFTLNWVKNPLELVQISTGQKVDNLINWFLTADLLMAVGITDKLTVGLDLPINLANDIELVGFPVKDKEGELGDLMFIVKYQLRDTQGAGGAQIGLGAIAFLTAPTGEEADFFGDTNVTGGIKLVADRQFGRRHYLGLNLGARFRETEQFLNLKVGHEFLASLAYRLLISAEYNFELIAEVFGSTTWVDFASQGISSPFEALAALRKRFLDQRLLLTLGAGAGLNTGYGAPDVRVFTGLTYHFNAFGSSSAQPADEDQAVVASGQLELQYLDSSGKPMTVSTRVKDAEGTQVADGKGKIFEQELPPGEYELSVSANGFLPKKIQVTIIDGGTYSDSIEMQTEEKAGEPALSEPLVLPDKIYFPFGQDELDQQSSAALDAAVEKLNTLPAEAKLRIEAHTDNVGEEAYNLVLSKRRAQRIRDYLVERGVSKERIETAGLGASQPLESNQTREGRAKNRRAELLLLHMGSE